MLTELESKIFKKCPDHLRQSGEDHQQDGVGQEDHHGGHPGGQQSACSLEMILIQCCNNNSSSELTTKAISRPPLIWRFWRPLPDGVHGCVHHQAQ